MNTILMKGWDALCTESDWIDTRGMWARKATDGQWFVIKWLNIATAVGAKDFAADGGDRYECEVKLLDFRLIPAERVCEGLNHYGFEVGKGGIIVDDRGREVCDLAHADLCIVQCCIDHGFGAPLEAFHGSHYPMRIRAQAKRYAERLTRGDAEAAAELKRRLVRPVNGAGDTAQEYGGMKEPGPFDEFLEEQAPWLVGKV